MLVVHSNTAGVLEDIDDAPLATAAGCCCRRSCCVHNYYRVVVVGGGTASIIGMSERGVRIDRRHFFASVLSSAGGWQEERGGPDTRRVVLTRFGPLVPRASLPQPPPRRRREAGTTPRET